MLAGRVRPWLPVFEALAANAPLSRGEESGLAGARAAEFGRRPTAAPPPVPGPRGYEAVVRSLVAGGAALDRRMVYWYARPSEHVPTLEIRVADVNADLDCTVLLAVLARGLCGALLAEARVGRAVPDMPADRLREAHRRAAADGLAGRGGDPETGDEAPMRYLVERLVARAAPGLAAAGDLAAAHTLLDRCLSLGGGADRQRRHFRRTGSLRAVVDRTAALTVRSAEAVREARAVGPAVAHGPTPAPESGAASEAGPSPEAAG